MIFIAAIAATLFGVLVAWIGVSSRARSLARAIVLAAAAATPTIVALILALTNSGTRSWSDWLLSGVFATVFCLIASVIAVTVLGVPLAWLLRKTGRTTAAMYSLAGAAAPLVLYGVYCVYKWHQVDAGPFDMSLKDQVALEGLVPVIRRIAFTAYTLAVSGILAAYVYRLSLHSTSDHNPRAS